MSRNPRLQLRFRMIGLGENTGSGFPVIISAWNQQHWRLPELEENTNLNYVSLKLWMLSVIPDDCLEELKDIYGKSFSLLNDRDKVLALVTAHLEGKVTNSRLQAISNSHQYDITKMLHDLEANKLSRENLGFTKGQNTELFKSLLSKGLIISEGIGKGTTYKLNE